GGSERGRWMGATHDGAVKNMGTKLRQHGTRGSAAGGEDLVPHSHSTSFQPLISPALHARERLQLRRVRLNRGCRPPFDKSLGMRIKEGEALATRPEEIALNRG